VLFDVLPGLGGFETVQVGAMGVSIVVSSCLIALFWVVVWYVGAWLTTKLSPRWPKSTVASENSPYWGSCTIMSTVNAVISASVCVPAAYYYLWKSPEQWFNSAMPIDFCYDTTAVGFTEAAVAVALVGQSFSIRTAIDMLLQFIHGLLTVEEAIHHVIYILAGFLVRRHCMMPMNAAILMSMEISTPFLNYYLFFRTRYPFSKDVNVAKTIFGVLFLAFRILLNSFGVFIFLRQHWWIEGGLLRCLLRCQSGNRSRWLSS